MLTDDTDHVVGVDTHRDHHTLAVVDRTGGAGQNVQIPTDAFGYRRMLAFGCEHAPGRRVRAIEGTGSFGAGLTTYLLEHGERVVEIDRPQRPARRNGAKTDELDAVRAAREALSREHLAQPRRRGDREAMRVLVTTRNSTMVARTKAIGQLKALVVGASEQLRQHFRGISTDAQLERCSRLRTIATHGVEHRATVRALRTCARAAAGHRRRPRAGPGTDQRTPVARDPRWRRSADQTEPQDNSYKGVRQPRRRSPSTDPAPYGRRGRTNRP